MCSFLNGWVAIETLFPLLYEPPPGAARAGQVRVITTSSDDRSPHIQAATVSHFWDHTDADGVNRLWLEWPQISHSTAVIPKKRAPLKCGVNTNRQTCICSTVRRNLGLKAARCYDSISIKLLLRFPTCTQRRLLRAARCRLNAAPQWLQKWRLRFNFLCSEEQNGTDEICGSNGARLP